MAIEEAIDYFSMPEFLEHSPELLGDEGEHSEHTTQEISDAIKSYLAHWIHIHVGEVENLDPANITYGDVRGLMNKTVIPYLRNAGVEIKPALTTVEGAQEYSVYESDTDNCVMEPEICADDNGEICPSCFLTMASCDCNGSEVKEAAGPTPGAVKYHMNKAKKRAAELSTKYGKTVTPRLSRASNGEASIVYDVETKNGTKTFGPYHLPEEMYATLEENKDPRDPKDVARRLKWAQNKIDGENAAITRNAKKQEIKESFTYGDPVVITSR